MISYPQLYTYSLSAHFISHFSALHAHLRHSFTVLSLLLSFFSYITTFPKTNTPKLSTKPRSITKMLPYSFLPLLSIAHATSLVAAAPLIGNVANQVLKGRIAPTYWQPGVGTSWQIVLSGTLDANPPNVAAFDLDLFDTPATTISSLHSKGSKVSCYCAAGALENWRPDASSFPASVVGSPLDGWPGENWLDIRSPLLQPIMSARLDLAVSKGCDGVDPDNVDGYDNNSGFPLTQADSVAYMQFLAGAAHSRGLAIGLKNAGDIIPKVIGDMQWAVNEQCVQYDECDVTQPFIAAGKPVFHIEYPDGAPNVDAATEASICGDSTAKGFSTLLKDMNLDNWFYACPDTCPAS